MRSKLTSRMLAALLAVVMVVGLLPMTALAARVIRDDAPMAEAAMGEEAVAAPVRATSMAAEVAEVEEGESAPKLVTVAKAELGTSATFGGDQVALSNALYTFVGSGTTGYTISATVPGTETTVYLNIGGGTNILPNMTSANGTLVGLTEQTDSNSNKWFELRDSSSLHFHRGANELYFNRCTPVSAGDMPNHYFALFRAAAENDTSSGDIPGYVRLTALNEVTSGGAYLIAAKVSDNWYVLYPTTSSDKYAHVAKVVLVEEVVETPDEPETPVEKTRYYFESVNMEGGAWKISDGSVPNPNTVETQNGSDWVSATEIVGGADRNYRLWAPGPGYLNFDKVGDVLLTNKLKGGQNAASIQFKKQDSNVYLISYVKDGTTYYLTAENQTSNDQDRAVFSSDKADAVPYFIEAETAGSNVYRIYCVGPYTVSFDGEGAVDIEDAKAMYGQKLALPTPTREGYTFQGWYVGEDEVTGEIEVTGDVTLTAKWEKEVVSAYTPQDAEEAGYDVHYLTKNGSTGWTIQDTAATVTVKNGGNAVTGEFSADGQYQIAYETAYLFAPFTNAGAGVTNVTAQGGTGSDFNFVPVEDSNGGYQIKIAVSTDPELYLTRTIVDFTFQNNPWKGLQCGTEGETFYITPAAEPNNGTYWIWYQTEKQTQPDPDPGDDFTQTYASPAEAMADGKVVKYVGFNYNSRYWTVADNTDAAHCAIHLYQVADNSTETTASLVADTDGVDNNTRYVLITDPSEDTGMGVLHYSSDVTNQCRGVACRTTVFHAEHLLVFEAVDGGYSIRANSTTNKYLSLDASSNNQRVFKTERTVFYVTPAAETNDGTYYIWTATEPQLGDAISAMFDTSADNTWVFTGGRTVQGSFADIGLARTLAGQFEEYIRWQNRGSANDENGVPQGMQRYVTNTAYTDQTLANVVSDAGWARVTALKPRAAVYMVGDEDIGSTTFAIDLDSFITKSLALRNDTGFAVIIKGYKTEMTGLNDTVDTVVNALTPSQKSNVVVVDGALTADQLSEAGYPNAKGHLKLAENLAAATVGSTANFPTSRNDAAAIANDTWANKLTDNGVTIFGETPETLTAAQQAVKDKVDDKATPMTWLFMGDSITHGALWAEGDGTISQNFEKFVKDDLGRTSDVVINTAVSGATSATTVREIQARLNKYDPDVVSIMIGTNDAAGKRVTVADYKTNLNTILTAISNKDAIAVLRTPIPNGSSGRGNYIHEYVDAIWEVYNGLSAADKEKVIVVDQFAQWAPYLMTADDGTGTTFLFGKVFDQDDNKIHPGPIGHLWMTQELIDGLGLWDSSKNLCKLSYQENWGITSENSTVSLVDTYTYDADSRTLSVSLSKLNLSGTVISAELTANVNGKTYTASYLRGQEETLTITFPEGADSAQISAAALVSVSTSAGKKVSFASAEVDLSTTIEDDGKMPAPAEVETAYEYRLDTDGLDSGEYGITAPGNNRTVGMHDSGSYTNQCAVTITGEVMTLPHDEHNWTVVQKPNGKYTIQGSGGKYLTSADCTDPSNQLVLSTEAEEFTVTHVGNGSYTVQSAAGKYLTFTETGNKSWGMADSPFNIQLFKKTEVEPDMAQTKFSGTSDKPMDRRYILNQNDDVDTDYRIPALTTLKNGWIVAACDIRWSSTADSPNNLDTIVSISKDGGVRWEWEVVNYFSDFAPINGSTKKGSASFIDPAVVQSEEDGSIYLLVDAQAPYVNGGKIGNGFDDQGRLKISKSPVNDNYSMENAHDNNLHGYTFDYYVDINNAEAGANYTVGGKAVKLWPICANDDDLVTGYYVDAFFNTYYDYGEGDMRAVIAQQRDSTAYIHNNIFYTQSEWKVFPTAFLMLRKATVNETTGKLDWGEPTLISSQIKYDNEHFIGVCPGRGFTTTVIKNGETVERILFALYDNATGTEKASVIYSDDGGVTWNRGARVENGETTSNSESQIVELHDVDGNSFLRMFSRNPDSGQYVSYADSIDNGLTWTPTKFDRNMPNGYGTMMSFIGLEGFLVSPEGDVYEDVVLASYPRGDGTGAADKRRTNGIVRIGYYDAENEVMVWLNGENAIRYPYKFTYSCLTQLRDGDGFTDRFALLYEDERTWTNDGHGMEMGFDTFTSADLLGEGWSLVREKPALPSIESGIVRDEGEVVAPVVEAANVLDLDKDTTGALTAAVTLIGEGENDEDEEIVVVWTSSDESVATVSKDASAQASLLSVEDVVTAPGEKVIINAVGVGRAYITATTTKNGITRKAVTEVVVQDEHNITVPERYTNDEMVTTVVPETKTVYELDTDGDLSGVYAIFSQGNGARIMYNNTSTTNHCQASPSNGVLTSIDCHATNLHLWRVTKQADGTYTIQGDSNDKYLTDTANGTQLSLGDTATKFTITHQGSGTYYVSSGGSYLAWNPGWKMQSDAFNIQLFKKVDYVAGTTYTVNAEGLEKLIVAGEKDEADYAETLALAATYTDKAAADAAQAQIEEATKALYAELTERKYTKAEEPEPPVDPEPEEDVYTVGAIVDRVYNGGNPVVPTVIVRKNNVIMTTGYELNFINNIEVGTATVEVLVDGEVVATRNFQIVEGPVDDDPIDDPDDDIGTGTGTVVVSRPVATVPFEEDLDDQDVPLANLPTTFVDVRMSDWFCAAAEFVFAKNLMQGVSATEFRPEMNTTRGMVVTILHRMEQEPKADPAAFVDVAGSAWYADAVAWGAANNVVKGVDDGGFHPTDDVTREQLAAFLYRFAKYRGYDVTARGDLSAFTDGESVSGWAADAMSWAVGTGLITGKSGDVLDPLGTATRAELATVLTRFCQQFAEEK